jgi:hypothetical protein
MKIGLISDTHAFLDDKIFKHFEKVDEIWHAGDIGSLQVADQLAGFKPLRAVYGNIDDHEIRSRFPEHMKMEIEGLKVWMTHIGGKPPRYSPGIKNELRIYRPDIFICGHSHIAKVSRDHAMNDLLYINPGAAGRQGFHQWKTIIRMEIAGRKVENLQLIELGRRGSLS